MSEKNNLLKKLIEKPAATAASLSSMVKTRWQEGLSRIEHGKAELEEAINTPPTDGDPTTTYFRVRGICSFWDYDQKYIYDPESKRWTVAPAERNYMMGDGMH